MIYLSEIGTRLAPEACHVMWLPIVQPMLFHSSAFVPNRATSPHSFISISRIPSLKDTLRFIVSMEKLPGDGSRPTAEQCVHTRPVAKCQIKCQLIPISVPLGSND